MKNLKQLILNIILDGVNGKLSMANQTKIVDLKFGN